MALTDMNDILAHAFQHGYAVGAFTVPDLDSLSGVIAAAEAARAPVLLAPEADDDHRLELLFPAVEAAAHKAQVPVAIQAVVAADTDAAARAIRLGCNGLRVHGTTDSFPGSLQQVKEVAGFARACGLSVAAEPGPTVVSTASEARHFVDNSDIDGLWLDLGMGDAQASGKGRPDFARLNRINKELEAPLLFDAGKGLSQDQYHRLIRHGVAAIGYLAEAEGHAGRVEAVANHAERAMRMWGAAGRAAEVLAQCAPWENLEQILLCNSQEPQENGMEMEGVLAQGERTLARLPGVRRVVGLQATAENAPYRYGWRVHLCHPTALTHLQEHPEREALTHGRLHPAVEGCIGIPYRYTGRASRALAGSPEPAVSRISSSSQGVSRTPAPKRNLA